MKVSKKQFTVQEHEYVSSVLDQIVWGESEYERSLGVFSSSSVGILPDGREVMLHYHTDVSSGGCRETIIYPYYTTGVEYIPEGNGYYGGFVVPDDVKWELPRLKRRTPKPPIPLFKYPNNQVPEGLNLWLVWDEPSGRFWEWEEEGGYIQEVNIQEAQLECLFYQTNMFPYQKENCKKAGILLHQDVKVYSRFFYQGDAKGGEISSDFKFRYVVEVKGKRVRRFRHKKDARKYAIRMIKSPCA